MGLDEAAHGFSMFTCRIGTLLVRVPSLPDILPSTLSSIETVEFVSLDRDEIYFLLTDVKNYPLVLPKNILSVEIINKTQNTIIAKEEIFERGITTTLLVKHIMSPPFNHTIQIIDCIKMVKVCE